MNKLLSFYGKMVIVSALLTEMTDWNNNTFDWVFFFIFAIFLFIWLCNEYPYEEKK